MKIWAWTVLSLYGLPALAGQFVPFSADQQASLGVETGSLLAVDQNFGRLLPGEVAVPNERLRVVTAPQQGLVEVLLVAEGDQVERGQALVHIQSPDLLELQGEYLELLTRAGLAETNYRRDRQLDQEGIIARRRLLESRSQYEELKTSLSRVRQLLVLAGMDEAALEQLESARELSSTLTVRSPLKGVVLEQMATAGNRVEAADPLYKIANLERLWLEIHVPLDQLGVTGEGQQVLIPSLDVSGVIISIGRMVHGTDQGVLVRAEINEGVKKLRPGQFVQVQLARSDSAGSYRVPRGALVHSGGRTYLFVARQDGFEPVSVQLSAEESSHVIVQAALPADARIAITGAAAIKAAWLGGGE